MPSATVATDNVINDEIIQDKHALHVKQQMMGKMKWSALLGIIAESCKFIAGPLFGCAVGAAVTAGAIGTLPLVLLGVATAFLLTGIATGFASTRIWQSSTFDNFELNAQSTARHLVQELKSSRTVTVEEHTQNTRTDGKTWVQATNRAAGQPLQPQNG